MNEGESSLQRVLDQLSLDAEPDSVLLMTLSSHERKLILRELEISIGIGTSTTFLHGYCLGLLKLLSKLDGMKVTSLDASLSARETAGTSSNCQWKLLLMTPSGDL